MDFRKYYDLEAYFFDKLRIRFDQQGYLTAFDFFCIIIWKSNRSKSIVAKRLLSKGYKDLESAVKSLTSSLTQKESTKEKVPFRYHGNHLITGIGRMTVSGSDNGSLCKGPQQIYPESTDLNPIS